jgi:predicted membrane channel-forming protein YqfA (hemolysin III family)
MLWVTLCLLGAACLPPAPRVAGFVAGGSVALLLYWRQLASELIAAQLALYLSGAAAFLRNGGHDRWTGLADHHFLHYFVTLGTSLHILYILRHTG